jgi:hypothetical protein
MPHRAIGQVIVEIRAFDIRAGPDAAGIIIVGGSAGEIARALST